MSDKCIIHRATHKSITYGGDLCKTYIKHVAKIGSRDHVAIIFYKHILTEDHEMYQRYGFKLLKMFNGKGLYKQTFSIKSSTFKEINRWINTI